MEGEKSVKMEAIGTWRLRISSDSSQFFYFHGKLTRQFPQLSHCQYSRYGGCPYNKGESWLIIDSCFEFEMCSNICTSLLFGTIWHIRGLLHTLQSQTGQRIRSVQNWNGLICVRNAELCDAGNLILFLSVMCSFSCWLVIQSLAVCATCSIFWALQSMWIKHKFQIFCFTTWWITENSSCVGLIVFVHCRSQPKEALSPRHVYRVGWHVCCWLWCKYYQFRVKKQYCLSQF